MNNNDWDPAHFEEVMQQKIIDGAVEAAVQAMRTECRKSNKEMPPEVEQKVRLEIATRLRGNISRRKLSEETE